MEPEPACPEDSRCEPGEEEGLPSKCINNTGTAIDYQGCAVDDDCAPEYNCVQVPVPDLDNKSVCMQWCRVGHDEDCPDYPNESCLGLKSGRYIGDVEWGVCWTDEQPFTWDSDLCENEFDDGYCVCGCGAFDYLDCANFRGNACLIDLCEILADVLEEDIVVDPDNNAVCIWP
jgi:hypothetical protein